MEILLVEDNPGDAKLTERALHDGKVRNRLSLVEDGLQAMAFLRRAPPYEEAPRPDIILLDLNLPKKDGRSVLRDVKNDPALRAIPVVIVTSSKAEEDIAKSYEEHANCYVTKPVNLPQFMKVVKEIENFWVEFVVLPRR